MDKGKGLRINEEIKANQVRLVIDGNEAEIVSIEDALKTAKEKSLDLVEISPNQDPPVVKLMDYSRYVFDQRKKSKEQKKKQKVIHLKEIKLRPAIASNDYDHKLNQAKQFIEKGDKVKFSIRFKGREIVHNDLGFSLLQRVLEDLDDIMQVEQQPTSEGRAISMIVAPLAGSKRKKTKIQDDEENN
ncbi:MAG: translation initiation factor IF-3 [Spirochaetes bacterium]|nr:translation initiation factor IF-3 [Spirochaetota bacterium]